MTNFDLYQLCNLIVNKDIYANAMSDAEFDLQLKAKSILLFTSKLPSQKSVDMQSMGTGVTRASQHDLSPFTIDADYAISANGTDGLVTIPGLYYIEDFWTATSQTSELISLQEVSSRRASYIKPPTATNVVAYIALALTTTATPATTTTTATPTTTTTTTGAATTTTTTQTPTTTTTTTAVVTTTTTATPTTTTTTTTA